MPLLPVAAVRLVARDAPSFDAWWVDFEAAVRPAAIAGARLICLPEYVCLGLLGTVAGRGLLSEREAYRAAFAPHREAFAERAAALARGLGVWLLAGTWWSGPNEAFLFGPLGERLVQPKLHPVPDEAAIDTVPGDELETIAIDGTLVGIATCYDVEFPEVARAFAERGVELLLVPSLTSSPRGAGRVATCAAARAIENGVFVVVVPLSGSAGLGTPSETTGHGDPTIFSPIDDVFPEPSGVLARCRPGAPFVLAELDLARLRRSRETGEVTPYLDRRPELYARVLAPLAHT